MPNLAQFFDTLTPDPEQVVELPKILHDDVLMRAVVRDTQLSEQLVEVPTMFSSSWPQRIMEQNVDIPVPGGGGETLVFKVFPCTEFNSAFVTDR